MKHGPITGRPVRFPPGMVEIIMDEAQLADYRRLYARSSTDLAGLPKLRQKELDGRTAKVTQTELDALNRALDRLHAAPDSETGSVFEAQERSRTRLFKRLQHLS